MNLRALWPRKTAKRLAVIGVVLLVALAAVCVFFRIYHPRDVAVYYAMGRECHPIWKEFAFRRVGAGDSAAVFLSRFPPSRREEFGRYGVYQYFPGDADHIWFTGFTVVSRDGRLVSSQAWSCTWQFTFFDDSDSAFQMQYAVFRRDRDESPRTEGDVAQE